MKTRRKALLPLFDTKIRAVVLLLLINIASFAQNNENQNNEHHANLVSPSPEAASLGKFVDVPISLYTGTPNVEIPIYTIQAGDITLPISLKYHASGLKVNEVASSVGAGWALNAGGSISRTIRGLADNSMEGYFTARAGEVFNGNVSTIIENAHRSPYGSEVSTACAYIRNWMGGCIDTEPDLYFISAPGLSHKFMFDRNRNIHLIPYDVIDITHPYTNAFNYGIDNLKSATWTVRDKSGATYVFGGGKSEKTATWNMQLTSCMNFEDITTWNLSKIISANGKDEINFFYQLETVKYDNVSITSYEYSNPDVKDVLPPSYQMQKLTIEQNRLHRITSSRGYEVVFNYDEAERLDLVGGHRLKEILIYYGSTLIKKFVLTQGYYESHELTNSNSPDHKALCLQAVQEFNPLGEKMPAYLFEYKRSSIGQLKKPARNSQKQDYWGFYEEDPFLGILTKITYPTGGEANFNYEPHSFSNLSERAYKKIPFSYNYSTLQSQVNAEGVKEYSFNIGNHLHRPNDDILVNFQTITSRPLSDYPCHPYYYAKLYKIENGQRVFKGNVMLSSVGQISLSSGSYVLRVRMKTWYEGQAVDELGELPCSNYTPATIVISNLDFINVKLSWKLAGEEIFTETGGGIRIKTLEIKDDLGSEPIIKYYDYTDANTQESSGILKSKYGQEYTKWAHLMTLSGIQLALTISAVASSNVKVSSKESSTPMSMLQGSYVGYSEVTVFYGSKSDLQVVPRDSPFSPDMYYGTNGKEVYKYTNPSYSQNMLNRAYPFVILPEDGYKYGLLLSKEQYRYTGEQVINQVSYSTFSKMAEEKYTYSLPIQKGVVHGIRANWSEFRNDNVTEFTSSMSRCPLSGANSQPYRVVYQEYVQKSEYILKTKLESFIYDDNGNVLSNEVAYTYNQNLLPKTETKKISDTEDLVTTYYYPNDIDGFNSNSPFVENYQAVRAMVNRYMLSVPIAQTVARVYTQDTNRISGIISINASSFKVRASDSLIHPHKTFSLNSTTPLTSFNINTLYENPNLTQEFEYLRHSAKGNLQSYRQIGGVTTCLIWGYNQLYPVAKIVGAEWSDIEQAFGGAVPNLSGGLSGSQELTLRNALPNAFIDTYTYDPTKGRTSQTDPNKQSTYYEYDGFGRLSVIKDFEGNVLKTYEYRYKRED